jgi:hypothetical protein
MQILEKRLDGTKFSTEMLRYGHRIGMAFM